MSKYIKLFNILVLVIEWELDSRDSISDETWQALLGLAHKMCMVKIAKRSPTQLEPTPTTIPKAISLSNLIVEEEMPIAKCNLDLLPSELFYHILDYISPGDRAIYGLLVSSKRNCKLMAPIVHSRPYLTSPSSIYKYFSSEATGRIQANCIAFGPSISSRLAVGLSDVNRLGFKFIPYSHSGLFTLLIKERQLVPNLEKLVHPIFYKIGEYTECDEFEEFVYHNEQRNGSSSRIPFYIDQSNLIIRKSLNSNSLSYLIRSCKKWSSEFKVWQSMTVTEALETSVMFLDFFQLAHHPAFKYVPEHVVGILRTEIFAEIRKLLTHVYGTLLLQIRFITANSQRLLDCYCLNFYRVLATISHLSLDGMSLLMGVPTDRVKMTNEEITAALQSDATGFPLAYTLTRLSIELHLRREGPDEDDSFLAQQIYSILVSLYQNRVPEEVLTGDIRYSVPIELLQIVITTRSPTPAPDDIVMLIERLAERSTKFPPNNPELKVWLNWLTEVVAWHAANKEMDPVKALLRNSMEKIDQLRDLQVLPILMRSNTDLFLWTDGHSIFGPVHCQV